MREPLIEAGILDEASHVAFTASAQDLSPDVASPPIRRRSAPPQSMQPLLVIFEEESRCDLPPDDVLSLLIASAIFAKAIIRMDRDSASAACERQCFDALAALKLNLRRVAWARALE